MPETLSAAVSLQPAASGRRVTLALTSLTRALALAMIGALVLATDSFNATEASAVPWWAGLVALALLASWMQYALPPTASQAIPILESLAVIGVAALAPPQAWSLALYLVVTPVLLGFVMSLRYVVVFSVLQASLVWFVTNNDDTFAEHWGSVVIVGAVLVGGVLGLLASWVRVTGLKSRGQAGGYAMALSLLEQLEEVTRSLSSGLNLETVADEVLETFHASSSAGATALFARSPGGEWRLSQARGQVVDLSGRPEWDRIVDRAIPAASTNPALLRQNPENEHRLFREPDFAQALIVPLGDQKPPHMVAVAWSQEETWDSKSAARAHELMADDDLRLRAADVYESVREHATAEERRRVSREIHDGVAQDLAGLAYLLDDYAAEADNADITAAADEVRRLVKELRLSIFDLRQQVGPRETIGNAIAAYAQQFSTHTSMVTHTTVSEHGPGLDPRVQHDLLRVCQEAVSNARRHSQARNLWIVYKSYSGGWLLRVSDDGIGPEDKRFKGLRGQGIVIMQERTARMDAALTVRRRLGGGTVVQVIHRSQVKDRMDTDPLLEGTKQKPALAGVEG